MEKFDLTETFKECPECGGIMQEVIATKAEMTDDYSFDNTTLVEWWDCLDCDYYVPCADL